MSSNALQIAGRAQAGYLVIRINVQTPESMSRSRTTDVIQADAPIDQPPIFPMTASPKSSLKKQADEVMAEKHYANQLSFCSLWCMKDFPGPPDMKM
jgi:hypothetical protein